MEVVVDSNGVGHVNGTHNSEAESAPKDLKRPREDDTGSPSSKKAKTAPSDDVVLVDEAAGSGAIVIDD
jgi:hypothetical protein